jgi:hypothetical protein
MAMMQLGLLKPVRIRFILSSTELWILASKRGEDFMMFVLKGFCNSLTRVPGETQT